MRGEQLTVFGANTDDLCAIQNQTMHRRVRTDINPGCTNGFNQRPHQPRVTNGFDVRQPEGAFLRQVREVLARILPLLPDAVTRCPTRSVGLLSRC